MRRTTFCSLVLLAAAILNGCRPAIVYNPSVDARGSGSEVPPLSKKAAEQILIAVPPQVYSEPGLGFHSTYRPITVAHDGFVLGVEMGKEGSPSRRDVKVQYADITDLNVQAGTPSMGLAGSIGYSVSIGGKNFAWIQRAPAIDFAKALYALRYYDRQERMLAVEPSADFMGAASQYRALVTKPAVPESIHRLQVQAEAAFREKSYDEAIDLYEQGVQELPTWAIGHFNEALLLGERERYRRAILQMNMYLALSPEAADAGAARNKVYEWERKVTKAP